LHENPFGHDVDLYGLGFVVDLQEVVNNLHRHDISGYVNRKKFFLATFYHQKSPSHLLVHPFQMLLVLFLSENQQGYDLIPFFRQVTMEIYLQAIISYQQAGQNPTLHDTHLTSTERITPILDSPLVQLLHISPVWHVLRFLLGFYWLLFVLNFEFLVLVPSDILLIQLPRPN